MIAQASETRKDQRHHQTFLFSPPLDKRRHGQTNFIASLNTKENGIRLIMERKNESNGSKGFIPGRYHNKLTLGKTLDAHNDFFRFTSANGHLGSPKIKWVDFIRRSGTYKFPKKERKQQSKNCGWQQAKSWQTKADMLLFFSQIWTVISEIELERSKIFWDSIIIDSSMFAFSRFRVRFSCPFGVFQLITIWCSRRFRSSG